MARLRRLCRAAGARDAAWPSMFGYVRPEERCALLYALAGERVSKAECP